MAFPLCPNRGVSIHPHFYGFFPVRLASVGPPKLVAAFNHPHRGKPMENQPAILSNKNFQFAHIFTTIIANLHIFGSTKTAEILRFLQISTDCNSHKKMTRSSQNFSRLLAISFLLVCCSSSASASVVPEKRQFLLPRFLFKSSNERAREQQIKVNY